MRVGVDRNKYAIHIPLPPKIDPTVTMMQVTVGASLTVYMIFIFSLKNYSFIDQCIILEK